MSLASSNTELQNKLAPLRRAVDEYLSRYLEPLPGCPARLADAMRYSALAPGKRLRPLLVLLGSIAVGGDYRVALPAACSVELIHAYSLIHDDLPTMDDDDLRRGLPTCHRKFDEATAILAGDALQALAFEILSHEMHGEAGLKCCQILSQAAGRAHLVGGQVDDLAAEGRFDQISNGPGSLEHLQSIHLRKTGALIQASVRMGGVACGASIDHLEMLSKYGHAIGLAFQVVDDCLDVESTSEQLGKHTRKDTKHGKLTYPTLLGLEASRRWADQLIDEACHAVRPLGTAAGNLIDIAKFVVERSN